MIIEPNTVREFMERLATKARNTVSRRGPIDLKVIGEIFEEIFQTPPDEKVEIFILRLPGLTSSTDQEASREFIDDDFVDACRAGDVCRYIRDPYDLRLSDVEQAASEMGELGCRLTAITLDRSGITAKEISAALDKGANTEGASSLSFDIIRVMQQIGLDYTGYDICVKDGFFDVFDVTPAPNLSGISFQECYFNTVEFDMAARKTSAPRFKNCQIDQMIGPVSEMDIPKGVVTGDTEIGSFAQEAQTNADILALEIALSLRVLLTILRKLFVQTGRGRKENAFYRGLDTKARAYVSEILHELQVEDFAHPSRVRGPAVWIPNRARGGCSTDLESTSSIKACPC